MTIDKPILTDDQMLQIQRHAVNDVTRTLAVAGALISFEQLDEMSESDIAWMRARLGLRTVSYSDHAELVSSEITTQDRFHVE